MAGVSGKFRADISSDTEVVGLSNRAQELVIFPASGAEQTPLVNAICSAEVKNENIILVSSVAEVNAVLDQRRNARILVLYVRPDRELAAALAAGVPLTNALEACREEVDTLLALVRRDRKRVFLVERSLADIDPGSLAEVLRARLGSCFPNVTKFASIETTQPPELERALALLALLERPDLRRLHAELEASSIFVPSSQPNRLQAEFAIEELAALRKEAFGGREVVSLSEENRSLLDRLFKVQDELEVITRSNAALSNGQRELAEQLSQARAAAEAGSRREEKVTKSLQAVYASTSWRLTKPVRAAAAAIRGLLPGKHA